MEVLKKIRDHRAEIFLFSILLAIFAISSVLFWGHQGHPILDCGREAYIPAEILKGKVLYKDIFILYGPLAYQINALLYGIFGVNLNTLYGAGVANSLIILITFYLIARTVTDKFTSWTASFMVMAIFIFHYFITSYTFPYTYAVTIALSSFLLSLLFCIYYLKTSNPEFIPFSCVFIAVSLMSKVEYSLFLIVLLAIILYLKPVSKKYLIISLVSSLIIPIISWTILFYQGLTLPDISNYLQFFYKYSTSGLVEYFYRNYTGFYFSKNLMTQNVGVFWQELSSFAVLAGIVYFFLLLISDKFSHIIRFKIPRFLKPVLVFLLIIFFPVKLIKIYSAGYAFCWIPVSTTIILIILVIHGLIKQEKRKIQTFKSSIREYFSKNLSKEPVFIFITLVGIISTLKSYFNIDLMVFGTFVIPVALLVNVVFLTDYLPEYFKFLDKQVWKNTCLLILVLIALFIYMKHLTISTSGNIYPLKTERGTLYSVPEFNHPLDMTVKYINKNVPQKASILVIPEGLILNFLTDRPSHGWYYSLIPNYVETLGEDKIINNLEKNPPDYIFVNNRECTEYGFPYFGKDYGFEIDNFIKENYEFQEEFGDYFNIKIFKKLNHRQEIK
ncbi:MAG: hypothetical protein PHC34_13885 [Candidatus Gastranaerophilales bacterium]|nr:hypothetical protein [Candidatus Gastranaerophilales bacterium]